MPSMYYYMIIYVLSFYLIMGSESWFMVWMGFEVNMISFIMFMHEKYNQNSMESCWKYFFIQGMGSAILMMGFYMNNLYMSDVIIFILSYKMGGAPFYFWIPSVCKGLSWMNCFMLLTFQKLMPLMLMMMFISWVMWVVVMMNLLIGTMGSFNQSNLKLLMVYSSIHHLGWIILCNIYVENMWLLYMIMYMIILLSVVLIFKDGEINNLYMISSVESKWWFSLSLLSLAGMPPMLGFFLKWMMFIIMVKVNFIMMMLMVLMSVVMFYVYFRLIYDVFICYKINNFYIKLGGFSKFMKTDLYMIMNVFGIMLMLMVFF